MVSQEMLIDNIVEVINAGNYDQACQIISEYEDHYAMNDIIAILAASVYEQLYDAEHTLEYILAGLRSNPYNYELYLMLGNYYAERNADLAYLSYENAVFHCREQMKEEDGSQEDYQFLLSVAEDYQSTHTIRVNPVSIIVLSYNTLSYTRLCIDSIRNHCAPEAYELIVIDNASTDGSVEWLKEQTDLTVIYNTNNVGFPAGCNQGIAAASDTNDIFLLNNDTIIMPNALYTLRMGLYQSEQNGAAGSVTNCAGNYQTISETFDTMNAYSTYAIRNNIPDPDGLESRYKLIGFALLIRRSVLNEVGVLDERFTPGNFEDDDICYRISLANYKNVLCHNSFIYHYGSKSFEKKGFQKYESLIDINYKKFFDKWNIDPAKHTHIRTELSYLFHHTRADSLRILVIGCGEGSNLGYIQYLFPRAALFGIDKNPEAVDFGSKFYNIIEGNIETMELPYEKEYFNYIILGELLEQLASPCQVLTKLRDYLRSDGYIIASISNALNAKLIYELLHGDSAYQCSGIQSQRHIRYYTSNDIVRLFKESQYQIKDYIPCTMNGYKTTDEPYADFFDQLLEVEGVVPREDLDTYNYLVSAMKI